MAVCCPRDSASRLDLQGGRHARVRGVALITMLLFVALTTVLMTGLLRDYWLTVSRARNNLDFLQAREYVLGAEIYARLALERDFAAETATTRTDSRQDVWGRELPPFEIEGGELEIQIRDLQGLFNLNSLGNARSRQQFRNLLGNLQMDLTLVERAKDWLDADTNVSGLGAEDAEYLQQTPPFRAANQPFFSRTELALLAEKLSAKDLNRLGALLSVLPDVNVTRINVNTANAEILRSLAPGISQARAAALMRRAPFAKLEEVVGEYGELGVARNMLTLRSDYFLAEARCRYRSQTIVLASVVHRDPETGRTTLVRRSFNPGLGFSPIASEQGDVAVQ